MKHQQQNWEKNENLVHALVVYPEISRCLLLFHHSLWNLGSWSCLISAMGGQLREKQILKFESCIHQYCIHFGYTNLLFILDDASMGITVSNFLPTWTASEHSAHKIGFVMTSIFLGIHTHDWVKQTSGHYNIIICLFKEIELSFLSNSFMNHHSLNGNAEFWLVHLLQSLDVNNNTKVCQVVRGVVAYY